jgi:hypothetical protein
MFLLLFTLAERKKEKNIKYHAAVYPELDEGQAMSRFRTAIRRAR